METRTISTNSNTYTVNINKYNIMYHTKNEQGEQVIRSSERWATDDGIKELTDMPPVGVDMVTYTFLQEGIKAGEPIDPSWVGSLAQVGE
jgi:hypothetical protein